MRSHPSQDEGLYGVIKDLVRSPVHAILSQLYGESGAGSSAQVDVLTYVHILEYAAARRADRPEVVATLVRRERRPDSWLFTQVFVDRDNNLIHKDKRIFGRAIAAKAVDDELSELFGDAESITVELP